jgi:hypothetical protein
MQKTCSDKTVELEEMMKHPIDFSDIPPVRETNTNKGYHHYKDLLDNMPQDLVQEMARRRLEEMKAAGYEIDTEKVSKVLEHA